MTHEELLNHIDRLLIINGDPDDFMIAYPQAKEFLRVFAGKDSAFFKGIENILWTNSFSWPQSSATLSISLESFKAYIESGLAGEISPKRKVEIDVVSDFLSMANLLLDDKKVHPAAAAVLIGATVEEFLRNWIDDESLRLGSRKPGLENYSSLLREAELITKQDAKDITAWAGIRNHAAHGEWELVNDRARIRLMLEGVNLFMRKYVG